MFEEEEEEEKEGFHCSESKTSLTKI